MKLLEGLPLEEKQRLYYNGSHCPYCGAETEYRSSEGIYQEYTCMLHVCNDCDAHVGCIPGSDQSMGMLAKKGLRNLRIECHKVYDPLIDAKVNQSGVKRKQAQAEGRKWLSSYLDIEIECCHIGYFDEEQCRRVIEKCKTFYPTPEQIQARKKELEQKLQLVRDYSKEFLFELKEFEIMGMVQMELKRSDGKILYLKPKTKEARWATKKKPFKFEDIESLIIENFKP